MKRKLLPIKITFAVFDEARHGDWGFCEGELEVLIDSNDTAWVTPCDRLHIDEEIINLVADELRPMGITWMRGWGNGGREGRVLTANGPVNCEPWSEVYSTGDEDVKPSDK